MMAIEKIVKYNFQEERACHATEGPHGEALGFVRRQRKMGNCRQEFLLWFL